MSPLDAAFHDWADQEGGCSGYEAFTAGWDARAGELDQLAGFWRNKLASVEAERDAALMKLTSCQYERTAFKRQRDELARALVAAEQQP